MALPHRNMGMTGMFNTEVTGMSNMEKTMYDMTRSVS